MLEWVFGVSVEPSLLRKGVRRFHARCWVDCSVLGTDLTFRFNMQFGGGL